MSQTFPLTNPITLLLDKSKQDYTREDMIQVMEKKGIEKITFHYTALDGKLKELKLPITNRLQAERVLAEGERVDGSSLFKGMVDAGLSDVYAVPVYKTAFLNPFDPSSLDFVCRFLTNDGKSAHFASDTILMRAHQQLRETTGFELHALGELEFFLISEPGDRCYPMERQRGYHAAAPFLKCSNVLNEMITSIAQITGAVKYSHSEVGYIEHIESELDEIRGKQAEQLEIEFLPTPVEDAGDNLVLARWLVRAIAYRHGYLATFAPKLQEGIAGNGMHIHLELMKDGRNVMTDNAGKLTSEARRLIGGLCTYADSLTAFGNTVSSAYLRMVPNQEAPTNICWSDLNRSAMIRVPLAWTGVSNLARRINPQQDTDYQESVGRQSVELRTPDGSAISHLLLAGMTMAVEWGLKEESALKIAEDSYVTGNIFRDKKIQSKLPPLPGSCVDSAEILLKKRHLYERNDIFPSSMINYIAKLLMDEEDDNMEGYLNKLPKKDRPRELQRIMQKDLHRH